MKSNRKWKQLLLLLVLTVSLFVYLSRKEDRILAKDKPPVFLDDFKQVHTVIISDAQKKQFKLVKKAEGWSYDDRIVQKSKINMVQQLVLNLRVKNRFSAALTDSINLVFDEKSFLFQCKDRSKGLLTYQILVDGLEPGTAIVRVPNSPTSYFVHLFGEEFDFKSIFTVKPENWLSLIAADFSEQKILKVCFKHFADSDFCIESKTQGVVFTRSDEITSSYDMKKGLQFLTGFEKIQGLGVVIDSTIFNDLIVGQDPFYELRIKTADQEQLMLGYRKKSTVGQRNFSGEVLQFDDNQFYLLADDALYLMDYFTFDPYFKTTNDFLDE